MRRSREPLESESRHPDAEALHAAGSGPAASANTAPLRWIDRSDLLALLALAGLALSAYGGLLDPSRMLADYDAYVYFYPLRAYAAQAIWEGRLPLWNPDSFLGSPFLANPQTALFYPGTWLFFALPVPYAYSLNLIVHVLLAGFGFLALCRSGFRFRPLPSFVGAAAFMLGGVISGQYGHLNQVSAVAWLPLILLSMERAAGCGGLRAAAAGAGLIALQLLAGHPQQSYMTLLLAGWMCVWRSWSGGARGLLRAVGLLGLAVAIGAGVAAAQLLPSAELASSSIRGGGLGYRDAVAGSLWPWLLPRALLPSYTNDLGSTEYLGYVGLAPLFLAGVALGVADRRSIAFGGVLAALGLSLALGGANPLYETIYRLVPGLSSFRVPARWLLVYTVGVSVLAATGMSWLQGAAGRALSRPALARLLATAGGLLLLCLASYLAGTRAPRWLQLVWAGTGIVTLALAVGCTRPGWKGVAAALLAVVVGIELWAAGGDLAPRRPVSVEAYAQPRDSTMFVQSRLGGGRFLSIASEDYELKESPDYREWFAGLPEQAVVAFLVAAKRNEILAPNVNLLYGIPDVDGYDGGLLPTRHWLQLAELLVPAERVRGDGVLISRLESLPPPRLMDLLNLRVVLAGRARDHEDESGMYDRSVVVSLRPGERLEIGRVPDRPLSAVGMISWTDGRPPSDGEIVAELELTGAGAVVARVPIRAERETAAGLGRADRPLAATLTMLRPWTSTTDEDPSEYLARISVQAERLRRLAVVNRTDATTIHLRAIALIDERDGAFTPLVLDDRLERTAFFDMKVYEYPDVLGRAYLVGSVVEASDAEGQAHLSAPDFDPRRRAVVERGADLRLAQRESALGSAQILEQSPERVAVLTRAEADALLVLSDQHAPGWTATLDGRSVRVVRTNLALRGVAVPAGEHEVVFSYEPRSLWAGAAVSMAAFICLVLLLALPGRRPSAGVSGRPAQQGAAEARD